MAERRMFAKSIINSARFLRMPATSRLLYYDLGMAADDDGVVEAFAVMRMTGAVEDDLRVLVTKGFIKILNEDLVSHIVDWKRNNFIRNDRYTPSIYIELLKNANLEQERSTTGIPDDNQTVYQRSTDGIPSIGKDRLGESSLDQDNIDKNNVDYSGAEPEPQKEPEKPHVYSLELIDGSLFPIYQDDIDKWSSAYPAVDVMAQLRRMDAWLSANKKRRKTKNGIKRFINHWLSDEQDKGGIYRGNPNRQSPPSQGYSNPDNIDISSVF